MKKYISIIVLLTILVSGCSNHEEMENQSTSSDGKVFTASFHSPESRTYIEEGELLRWTEGDQISLFDGNTLNRQYKFDGKTGDNAGTFSIVEKPYGTGADLTTNYAIYPYASDVSITESGVIKATLPAEQSYAVNSFGLGDNTMVAVTQDKDDTFLKFKNVGGYLQLHLFGDDVTVKTITLTGNNDEKLAGEATITSSYSSNPTTCMADDAAKTITLDCGEGVKLGTTTETATTFWLVLPETTFKSGFTVTVTDINDAEFTQSTSKKIFIERNYIMSMTAFEVENNSVIQYTGTQSTIEPYNKEGFNVNIVSNTSGKMVFDGILTTINSSAFYNTGLISIDIPIGVKTIGFKAFNQCQSLSNVSLPKTLTSIGESVFTNCALGNITIPENVTAIGNGAFIFCESLSSVSLPSSLITIGDGVFQECSSLHNITIPENVTTIGSMVFYKCNKLVEIYCKSTTPPTLNGSLIGGTFNSNLKIFVPSKSVDLYKTATHWKEFKDCIEGYNF